MKLTGSAPGRMDAALAAYLGVRHTFKGGPVTDFAVPSADRFSAALRRLSGDVPENYLLMLKAHYRAPDRTITATELARAVGYKTYAAANLHYGTLAARLATELEQSTGEFIGLKLLVSFVMPGEQGNAEIMWVMRPEVAEALETLGWVRRSEGA
jgi:5-methylcytosine-specific restriction protein A